MSVQSYFRLRQPRESALARLARFCGVPEISPLIETSILRAVDLATTPEGTWRLPALFIFEEGGWTVFDDLAGSFSARPADSWLEFVGQDEFVFAAYNDAIGYGELIVIQGGKVVREFLHDSDEPAAYVDRGRLEFERTAPIKSWIEVASFVDDDDLSFAENGSLWVRDAS
jgi:hypothetical protein